MILRATVILIGVTALAGCASEQDAPAPTPSAATHTTVSPPLIYPHRSDGTTFDPCHDIAASLLLGWGVQPPKPSAVVGDAQQAVRGCAWDTAPGWRLNILVSNQKIADYIAGQGAKPVTVGGRASAVTEDSPSCYISVPAAHATVNVGVDKASTTLDTCATATAIAADLARILPAAAP